MATTPGSSSTTQTLRNVIVGVTTTVLASTIVYFLGFHKSDRSAAESMLFTKEATIGAWSSYVSYENSFTKNWKTLGAGYNNTRFRNYKEETLDEFNKFFNDIKVLIETKDIDPDFSSLLKRRLKAREKWESKYKIHLDNYEFILNNSTEQERNQKLNEELTRFQTDVKDLDERFGNEIENIAKALTDKYHHLFSLSDLLTLQKPATNADGNANANTNTGRGVAREMIDRQSLVGRFLIDQSWYIYQYDDGRLYMYFTKADGLRDSVYGTWHIANNQLYQYSNYYFNAGNKWVYEVSDVSPSSFLMKLVDSPYTKFTAIRN